VDPVDPRPALLGVERAGGAEHEHRHAVAPGVEQAHHTVQQADIAVQHAGHRLAGGLGIAMRDRHRMILVQAEQNTRPLVAEVVDDAVVQPAVARAGVEADIGNAKAAQHLCGDVATPGDRLVRFAFDPIQLHPFTFSPAASIWRLSRHPIFCLHDRQKKGNQGDHAAHERVAIKVLGMGNSRIRAQRGGVRAFIPMA